jgi:hypothetical protein
MTITNSSAGRPTVSGPEPPPPALSLDTPPLDGNGWNWVNRRDRDATLLAGLLEEFVEYFNGRYAWPTEHVFPPCWAFHGALVEEITTLMWSRWSAFEAPGTSPKRP